MADEYPVFRFIDPPGTGPIIRIDNNAGATRDVLDFQKNSTETFSVDSNGLPDPGGGDATRVVIVRYDDTPADADALQPCLHVFEKAVTITAIYVCCDVSVGDMSTNKETIVVKNSTSDTTIATLALTGGTPMPAKAWLTMGAITNGSVTADTYIYATLTKTSSGLVMSGLTFRIEYTLAG
jgi:hypothetical protein